MLITHSEENPEVFKFNLIFLPLQTRKLRELLENSLGWDFQLNSAVDGMHFEENDEASASIPCSFSHSCSFSHLSFLFIVQLLQFAPVVEMLDDPSFS